MTQGKTSTFKKLFIVLVSILLAVLLIISGIVAFITYQPKALFSLVSKLTPYTITAEEFNIHPSHLRLLTKNLVISNPQGKPVANIGDMYFSTTLATIFNPQNKSIFGSVNNAAIYMQHVEKNHTHDNNSATQPSKIDISQQLQGLDISLRDIDIHLDKDTSVKLQEVSRLSDLAAPAQGLKFTANYQKAEQSIAIAGQFISSIEDNIPTFTLQLAPLNLSTFLGTATSDKTPDAPSQTEAVIDWRPLKPWLPIAVNVSSEKISLPQGNIHQLDSHLTLTETDGIITLEQKHNAKLDLLLGQQLSLKEPLLITSNLHLLGEQTQGADINGKTVITLGENSVDIDGKLNINHLSDNHIRLNAYIKEIDTLIGNNTDVQEKATPFLPLMVDTQLNISDKKIALTDFKMTANQSDINGNISTSHDHFSEFDNIEFALQSKQLLVIHHDETSNKKSSTIDNTDTPESLFNKQPLDIAWLNTKDIQGSWSIDQLIYNQHVLFKNSLNKAALIDNKLTVESTINDIAEGTVAFVLTAKKIDDTTLSTTIDSSVNHILLEALHLIPKEELSGTKTSASVTLSSQGSSTQALAENLQGDIFIEGSDGVIANNTFEIIGSDLLLKLVNTVNPFYKDSKNTALECVVIKSKINNGQMIFNDSIAIKTSKMIIVGDGEADLGKNTLDIGINPKARSGLGVDIASLAKFVALQGKITDPKIGVSGKGTLKSALNIGAAVSTGGLSLLANKLADKAVGGDPCVVAKNAFTQK